MKRSDIYFLSGHIYLAAIAIMESLTSLMWAMFVLLFLVGVISLGIEKYRETSTTETTPL